MAKKENTFNFETAIKELENIVRDMEKGGLSLEESLKFFAHGVALTKQCQEALVAAEQKVKILTNDDLVTFRNSEETI